MTANPRPLVCSGCGAGHGFHSPCTLCGSALTLPAELGALLTVLDVLDHPMDLVERAAFVVEARKLRDRLRDMDDASKGLVR